MKSQNPYIFFKRNSKFQIFKILLVLLLISKEVISQQDPQYTQYMYNTMSVNPGYAGSLHHTVVNALVRTQWVGIKGAPNTQTFSFHTPLGYSGLGLGLNIINDVLGPSAERYIDGNISYTIETSNQGNLSLGLKLGGRFFNVDWKKGIFKDNEDPLLQENINKFFATVGVGLYYYTEKGYLGLSIPNFISGNHYNLKNNKISAIASERLHYFLIGGYVFDLNESVKFKPAFLTKIVLGAPVSLDLSANFLFNERFTLGVSYRWGDSVSALLGFQATRALQIGYAYDLLTTNLRNYSSGTHEVMLKYELLKERRVKSPRFF